MTYRYRLALPVVVVIAFSFIFFGALSVSADSDDTLVLTVSENYKGVSGSQVKIPIYVELETSDSITITEIRFDIKYPEILEFQNIETFDDTVLWDSGGYFEESVRRRLVHVDFKSNMPINLNGKLLNMLFYVSGPKGSSGDIKIENFSIGQPDIKVVVRGSRFQVMPVANYFPDRDIIEIVSREPFSTFELSIDGSIGQPIEGFSDNSSGWFVSQNSKTIRGFSIDGQAITSLTIPVSEEGPFKIFWIRLNDGESTTLQRRETFLPTLNTGN